MAKYTKFDYVASLPIKVQATVRRMVRNSLRPYGFPKREMDEYVRAAMNSRLADLNATIDIKYVLKKANGQL